MTLFSENNLQADLTAFKALMKYIKEIDEKKHTIIMMQPENEDLRKIYNLIGQLTPIITDFHGQGRIDGIPLDKEIQVTILDLGQYAFTLQDSRVQTHLGLWVL